MTNTPVPPPPAPDPPPDPVVTSGELRAVAVALAVLVLVTALVSTSVLVVNAESPWICEPVPEVRETLKCKPENGNGPPSTTTTTTTGPSTTVATVGPTTTATTAPPSTTTTTSPPAGGFPDAGNTGVPPGTQLAARGSLTADQAGQVVDAVNVSGTVTVRAPNVTIQRSRLTGSGQATAVVLAGNTSGLKIVDSEIVGNYADAAIIGGNWTMTRTEVTGLRSDGVKMGSGATLETSWFHDFNMAQGAHGDGVQIQDGVIDVKIRGNNLKTGTGTGHNAAIFISPDFGPNTNGPVTVENNLLGGGGFTLYCVDGNNGQYRIGNITIRGNRWERNAQYGPYSVNVAVTWQNNAYTDGTPINL